MLYVYITQIVQNFLKKFIKVNIWIYGYILDATGCPITIRWPPDVKSCDDIHALETISIS